MSRKQKVVVVGGGVAGLTAAHELVERDFEVEVYEHRLHCGGKAASVWAKVGGEDVPGEHGFRFFPSWYRHLPDTLGRIPSDRQHRTRERDNTVLDHLVEVPINQVVSYNREPIPIVLHAPRSAEQAQKLAAFVVEIQRLGLSAEDTIVFVKKLVEFLSVPDEARRQKYDDIAWSTFVDLDRRTAAFRILTSNTRSLLAAKATEASAYTIATMAIRTLFAPSVGLDSVLDGPTSDVWIEPWVRHLEGQGVRFFYGYDLDGIDFDGTKPEIAALRFSSLLPQYADRSLAEVDKRNHDAPANRASRITVDDADYYVFSLPVEQMAYYVNRSTMMTFYDESLRNVVKLSGSVDWMAGVQFYMRSPLNVEAGHMVFADSEWSLTAIDQTRFWRDARIPKGVQSILSVDISAWDRPGRHTKKEAFRCTRAEIAEEVWHQIADSLNRKGGQTVLREEMLLTGKLAGSYHLDDNVSERYDRAKQAEYSRAQAVRFSADDRLAGSSTEDAPFIFGDRLEMNVEPLLINRPGSLALRPSPGSKAISNMFLAADYVDTATNLACMEGANEAARLAVNAILETSGSSRAPCRTWDFADRDVFSTLAAIARVVDQSPGVRQSIGVATSAAVTLTSQARRVASSVSQIWKKL
jgi:uncharacterized protein with NAD-binding domain and iron-sulfur cluster